MQPTIASSRAELQREDERGASAAIPPLHALELRPAQEPSRRRWAPRAMPSLDFDEKPKHLSRFDLSGEPASSSPSKPKAKIVEIG